MKINLSVIGAILKKDLLSLLPLVLLSWTTFLVVPLIASLDLVSIGGDTGFWLMLQGNIYWLGFLLGILLMISLLQLDPADSVTHDWLSRPIERRDWILAKLLFLLLAVVVPVLLTRILVQAANGLGILRSISYAAGIEELEAALLLPVLFAAALLTPTLRKLIFLLVLVLFAFMLPGWSVTRPMLAALGIELGNEFGGLMWVQAFGMFVVGLVGAAAVFWFRYCRRQPHHSYLAFWLMVAAMFLAVYPPKPLYDWPDAIAVNAALINSGNEGLEDAVILEQSVACFPAAFTDAALAAEQDNELLTQAAWPESHLQSAGPDALTFASSIRYREVLKEWFAPAEGSREYSVDWRLHRIRSQARVSADSLPEDVALRRSPTALNRYEPVSATQTDYWIVPAELLATVATDPSTQLIVEIDGTLLAPTSHELPVDGQRRDFPKLGSCMAEQDTSANSITVECLQRGSRPELISAQLIGLDSSRVDNAIIPAYTHDWIEAFGRERYELIIEKPSLTNESSIMLTSYDAKRVLREEVVIPGLLGAARSLCPLPGEPAAHLKYSSNWSDKSPHEVSSVAVERGVRLEVLDWGGGESDLATLILLPGLGATAHSYDDLAPKLAEHYRVLGMTRRGTGASSTPDRGYEPARLGRDVLAVMDTFGIDSAILVGHSFGGEELSFLGANHPERVDGLVYLDAAYDRLRLAQSPDMKARRELQALLPPRPPARPAESVSYAAMKKYSQRLGLGGNVPEGEIIASYDLSTGGIKHDPLYLDALMHNLQSPNYRRISVPALAIYAVPSSAEAMMESWYDADDTQIRQAVSDLFEMDRRLKLAEIKRFESGVRDSRVLILKDADHWVFATDEAEVVRAVEGFVNALQRNTEHLTVPGLRSAGESARTR